MRDNSQQGHQNRPPLGVAQTTRAILVNRVLRAGRASLPRIEPFWVIATVALVFVSYLLALDGIITWVALVLAAIPLTVRVVRRKAKLQASPFDIPFAILATAAVVGFVVSPDRRLSLGALQCLLAASVLYHTWMTYGKVNTLVKWMIVGVPIALGVALLVAFLDWPYIAAQPNFAICGTGTHHGLAMTLVIVTTALAGIALFSPPTKTKWLATFVCIVFVGLVVALTWESIRSLFTWESIRGRTPIWDETLSMLADSPITGLGLGCWAFSYYGTAAAIPEPTHAHNAYLELYANTGLLGALALAVALVVGAKLAWAIIRSPRNHPWYGFGIGVVMACVATLLVGVVESAPVGVPLVAEDTYYYLISPVPWILAGLLVSAHKLLKTEVKG